MDRLVRLLLVIGLLSSNLVSQQRNTVFQQVASNIPYGTTGPKQYQVTNNIGQTFHTFQVSEVGANCGSFPHIAYYFYANIQASYDNSVWFSLPQTVIVDQSLYIKLYKSNGAYPYIRLSVTYGPPLGNGSGTCNYNINYSGSLTASQTLDNPSPNVIQTVTNLISSSCTNIFTNVGEGLNIVPTVDIFMTGLVIRPNSGSPTRLNMYYESTCTSSPLYSFNASDSIMPDSFNEALFFIQRSSSGFYSLFAKPDSGSVNITTFTKPVD